MVSLRNTIGSVEEGGTMNNLSKSVLVLNSVMRLLLGSDLSTAVERTLEDYPQIRYIR
jgi:hypothetical protein